MRQATHMRALATRALSTLTGEDVGAVVFVFDRESGRGSYAATSEEDLEVVRRQLAGAEKAGPDGAGR